MMQLNTPVELPAGLPPVSYDHRLMLMGSCFAENMGKLLTEGAFRVDVNPTGILYNPLSVGAALREIISGRVYTESDLFFYRGCWHSPMHHGSFSSELPEETLRRINERMTEAHDSLPHTDWLMLTLGTAYVYVQAETGQIVANCHKLPERQFRRRRLTVDEIVSDYTLLLDGLWQQNPDMNILFTVSPIRHVRDGLHENQLSKSTLLLAIDVLQAQFPGRVHYFPSYEIVLDELRDYRFYTDDMLHPSSLAVHYIWERFAQTFFSTETQTILSEVGDIRKALAHKPFHPDGDEYKRFLGQIVLKINRLKGKYPNLDFGKEINYVILD